MPVTPTYPGVYIEEIPSGVRTITGVATSITAFIGLARRGPVNQPVSISSFSDFERRFGGLWSESMLSYAVRDFYLNGGSQALIIRVHNGATLATLALPTAAAAPNNVLTLEASSVGSWGATLRASVNHNTATPADVDIFNLTVFENVDGGALERFLNVSIDVNDARYLPRVLEQSSSLVRSPRDQT